MGQIRAGKSNGKSFSFDPKATASQVERSPSQESAREFPTIGLRAARVAASIGRAGKAAQAREAARASGEARSKIERKNFQSLEKSAIKFPIIGKVGERFLMETAKHPAIDQLKACFAGAQSGYFCGGVIK